MKISTLASLLLLSVAGLISIREVTAQCYDYTDALDIRTRTSIPCNIVNKAKDPSPASFVINYKCEIEANQGLCTKALQSIQKVGEILTSNLNLITNINVDVTLKNLCPTDANQPCNELGGAEFARTMELLDDDNVIREYPTSLVKQFDCEQHYEFGDVDIRAVFNGGNATSLWFEGDPQINPDQKDFRTIVLKEFINALGVQTSFIEQSIFSNLTPKVLTPQLTLAKGNDGVLEFKGFREYAFDKYIIIRGKEVVVQSITDFSKSINDFAKEPNNKFKDEEEFIAKFVQSPQIGIAQNVANISVTQFTLGFQPRGAKPDDVIVLETSLNPYQNSVSINSFDASTFSTTEEFLMVSPVVSGKTLEDSMGKSQSPLGPKLISLLETLGYPTKQLPGNNFKVCNIPPTSPSPPAPSPPAASPPAPPPTVPSPTVTTTAITTSITTQIITTIPVVVTTTVQQSGTSFIETETQHVVTKIESVSQSVVTTVKVIDVPPTQQASPTDDPNDDDIAGSGSLNIQYNFSLIFFITLISCISIL